eukprot:CAMPEP_0175101254 /NCGR_PEP_ID=MMETSP0086_2-20121207/7672_1 /TAXON_ID=136419 /ORGANISM="Unknown Unknown, Strain D1" /LENGTH=85 /DNA_ID=CAMNT_0016375719 /DNA_START=21 /DNA_END=275 /DNA_ORIENTATION=-
MPNELSNTGYFFMGNKVFDEADLLPPDFARTSNPGAARLNPINIDAVQAAKSRHQQAHSQRPFQAAIFPVPPHRVPWGNRPSTNW